MVGFLVVDNAIREKKKKRYTYSINLFEASLGLGLEISNKRHDSSCFLD